MYGDAETAARYLEQKGFALRALPNGKFVGLCPFHSEHTPSFHIYPSGKFYCYGCHERGDACDLVMHFEHVSFPKARQIVNQLGFVAPITAPVARPTRSRMPSQDEQDCMGLAGELFYRFFTHSDFGAPGRTYLFGERGITGPHLNATLSTIGYAPEHYLTELQNILRKRFGAQWQQLAEATGLVYGTREALGKRVVFLVRDDNGNVIYYQARTINGGQPKILGPAFRKPPYAPLRYPYHEGTFVVEGPIDAVAVAAQGFYAVGILGSVLPTIGEIKRWRTPIYGALDHEADKIINGKPCNPSRETQERLKAICEANGIPYHDWDWSPYKDPADALCSLHPRAFSTLLSKAA